MSFKTPEPIVKQITSDDDINDMLVDMDWITKKWRQKNGKNSI